MDNYFTPSTTPIPPSQRGEPPWELAQLFPPQGHWTEEQFLSLDTNHIVELVDGFIEVHPMASYVHQLLFKFLLRWLDDFVVVHELGEVLCAPFPVWVASKSFREPDLLFLRPGRLRGTNPRSVVGADLAVEIVSDGAENRKRDLETKPAEYALAGISEYWIVDPELETIIVHALDGAAYRTHGLFRSGDVANSLLLRGLALSVADCFAVSRKAR